MRDESAGSSNRDSDAELVIPTENGGEDEHGWMDTDHAGAPDHLEDFDLASLRTAQTLDTYDQALLYCASEEACAPCSGGGLKRKHPDEFSAADDRLRCYSHEARANQHDDIIATPQHYACASGDDDYGCGADETEDDRGENDDAWESGIRGYTEDEDCLLYTSPSPRDGLLSRMPSSA